MNFEPFTFIVERFGDLLTNQIKILCTHTEEEARNLQQEVEIAQILLKDVDEVQRQAIINAALQMKVHKIIGISEEIEDFLDSINQEEEVLPTEVDWVRGVVSRASHFSNSLKRKRSEKMWVKDLRERLEEATRSLKGYNLSSDSPQFTRRQRLLTQPDIINEEFIVRLEKDVETYVSQLVSHEANRSKDLAIFGMGGAGKTTTARFLYNHRQILEHFDKSAWLCVSQVWDKTQLLRRICVQVGIPLQGEVDEKVVLELKEFLRKSSCFFVLDDVWEISALLELLPILRSANSRGRTSRVLVTTRNKEIFSFPHHDFYIQKMRPLTPQESRGLFIKTLDRNNSQDCKWYLESEFVKLGDEMLEKCEGLPLAIVALSGILSSKTSLHEWETINNDVSRRILRYNGADDYGVVSEILELSYFDLPYTLKPCFLYLGIFPEDSDISVERLIQLWIAEGFIKSDQFSHNTTLEEIAMEFLYELVHRCLVEISRKDYGGNIVLIRIHDLIRDLCIHKGKDQRLFEVAQPSTSISTSVAQRSNDSNRFIIHRGMHSDMNHGRLRSLIYLGFPTECLGEVKLQLKQIKFLRVLRLEKVTLTMPIGDLCFLRYLELDSCKLARESLHSIKKLRNLLTLAIEPYSSSCKEIPDNVVGRMEHLRHLSLPSPLNLVKTPTVAKKVGVNGKNKLQTLRAVSGEWLTQELRNVSIGLQELHLTHISEESQLEAIYDFVSSRCEHLHKLFLSLNADRTLEFDLNKLKSRHCASLQLKGKIRKQRDEPIKFPPRLLILNLKLSGIEEEEQFKEALAELDELRSLTLVDGAYKADRLSMTGLPKLQELELWGLPDLKEWRIEKGALPKLCKLQIYSCYCLERLPKEIRCIGSLQHLSVRGVPPGFCNSLQQPSEHGDGEGEDFCLIRHVSFCRIE